MTESLQRTDAYSQFMAGFAAVTGLAGSEAQSQWAAFSVRLSDYARAKIEAGGEEAGQREGGFYKAVFPKRRWPIHDHLRYTSDEMREWREQGFTEEEIRKALFSEDEI